MSNVDIESVIIPAIKEHERNAIWRIKTNLDSMVSVANSFVPMVPELATIYRKMKPDKKEWGYVVNSGDAGYLFVLMMRLKIRNICDLGCGMGFLLKAMSDEWRGYWNTGDPFRSIGFDNEPKLLDICKELNKEVKYSIPARMKGSEHNDAIVGNYFYDAFKLKDITKLEQSDIPDNSIIYWWLPMASDEMARVFIENIYNVVKKGQIFAVCGHAELLKEYGCEYYGEMQNSTLEILQKV